MSSKLWARCAVLIRTLFRHCEALGEAGKLQKEEEGSHEKHLKIPIAMLW